MKISEGLRAAKALIDAPEKWIQGRYWDDLCEKFCALGACYDAMTGLSEAEFQSAKRLLTDRAVAAGGRNIPTFNDTHTHADVMAMFDGAIADAEAEGL